MGLGDLDKALEYLEEGYRSRSQYMAALKSEQVLPIFDPIRSDPRFQEILRKMNLPQK